MPAIALLPDSVDFADRRIGLHGCLRCEGILQRGGGHGPDCVPRRKSAIRRFVFARDEWRCHLCHLAVSRGLPAEHPAGPTLDHLVPRSAHGPLWQLDNLRLAHRHCNIRRGPTDLDQLDPAFLRERLSWAIAAWERRHDRRLPAPRKTASSPRQGFDPP
jgi:hypothetical protein